MKPQSVFIGTPTGDGTVSAGAAMGLFVHSTNQFRPCVQVQTGSLLTWNCNTLWAKAINDRKAENFQWFAMLHSDITPEANWLQKLIDLAEAHHADFVSAIVPIKDSSGLTSTAIGRYADDWGFTRRLTQREIWKADFPGTFTINDIKADGVHLLCNTGCCVVRMQDRFENGQVYFDTSNRLTLMSNGWQAEAIPEDWFFSRAIARAGGKVMATREVKVIHNGLQDFPNDQVWGIEREEPQ